MTVMEHRNFQKIEKQRLMTFTKTDLVEELMVVYALVGKLQNKSKYEKCSVKDCKGNNCPEEPKHFFKRKGEAVQLCERCFLAYRQGAYGDSFPTDNSDYAKCPDCGAVRDDCGQVGHESDCSYLL